MPVTNENGRCVTCIAMLQYSHYDQSTNITPMWVTGDGFVRGDVLLLKFYSSIHSNVVNVIGSTYLLVVGTTSLVQGYRLNHIHTIVLNANL